MGYRKFKIGLSGIEESIRINKRRRMEFVGMYAEWLRKAPNKVWSRRQKLYCCF